MNRIETIVEYYRRQAIQGACVDLVPYGPEHAEAVVRLRNLPDVRYFLNQTFESTPETQAMWYQGYMARTNDIFWILKDKSGQVVGCNRLYQISATQVEKGSLIVNPDFGRASPIALEADLRALQVAFDHLGVSVTITRTREDNVKMQSMNARFGFKQAGLDHLLGVPYPIFSLARVDFQPTAFESILEYWSNRDERRKT